MEVFTKVERGYWQDEFILELTPEQKFFYLYLMTNNKVNTLGAYVFPLTMSTVELGYNKETVLKLLDHFAQAGKIIWDETTKEVFLLNWPKRNWNRKTATLRALKKDFDALKSPMLREKISALLSAFSDGEAIDDTEEQKGTNGNNEKQKETNGNNGDILAGRIENREKRIENREKEKEKEDGGTVFDAAAAFEIFYKAYPNKKNVKTARTRWEKMKVTPELYREIMEGLKRAKNSQEWTKDDSAYIPHPATWLNGEGWKNEYKPLRQAAAPKAPDGNMPDPLAERRRMMGGGAV
jgi:phage replication protein